MTDEREEGLRLDPRYDRDGLITAVATDADTGDILMLAHMNAEALALTIETDIAHFWSRSRQTLWKKGETSGHFLRVQDIRVDCDQDAIWLVVKPEGPPATLAAVAAFTAVSMAIDWKRWMRRPTDRHAVFLIAATSLGLSACGDRHEPAATQQPDEPPGEVASSLETLAVESGALEDLTARDPVGSYGRTYDGGRDRLCLIPGDGGRQYRFGTEVRIGDDEHCRGSGTARRAGDRLIFSFSGGECMIVARYEGDRIVMPGAVDMACVAICSNRGSLAGVTFPRTGSDSAAAARVNGDEGDPLCG